MTRYCRSCQAQVSDSGGYCLLGHRLSLEPVHESIRDLRAEVEQVFEAARLEVEAVLENGRMTSVVGQPNPAPAAAAPAPPAAVLAPRAQVGQALQSPPSPPAVEHAPTSTLQPSAPPPSTANEALRDQHTNTVWSGLEYEAPIKGDPIEAFAPPPRMDWGPERTSIFRRRSHARRPSTAIV